MSGEPPADTAESELLSGDILVVDDDRLNRMKLSRSLALHGLQVELAENGQQALDILARQSFDVVLLDIVMPEMDGYEVLAQMKANANLRNIPVIVISALDEMDSVVRCIEMGAEDYLPKPFNPTLLRARLDASLRKKKLRDLERAYLQQEMTLRQNEKLATLGRLSAGMAHELNNPAAAAVRGANQLEEAVAQLQQLILHFNELELTAGQLGFLSEIEKGIRKKAGKSPALDALTRSDREYEIETWLEEQGIEESWRFAPTLVNLNYDDQALSNLANNFHVRQLSAVLDWLDGTYNTYNLLKEIGQGAGRISEIVQALKTYTYLDQAPIQSVDIHEGLDNTLALLHSKLNDGIAVTRLYGQNLPRIEAHGSELNQVWTNLIDNAIYAMDGKGDITIKTYQDGRWLVVEVTDSGLGIPVEIQSQIFDPFFTTKPPGSGAGLGLNISHNIITQKHAGSISVVSQPGRTCFQIKLPVK
ncbi:MAG: response regulator [Candidatus Promineifilaceae bacterium]